MQFLIFYREDVPGFSVCIVLGKEWVVISDVLEMRALSTSHFHSYYSEILFKNKNKKQPPLACL